MALTVTGTVDCTGHPLVELARGDALDYESLLAAAQGCRAAFYLVHSMVAENLQFGPKIIRHYGDLGEGLTQEQLARLPGVKRPNLSEMEKRPSGKNLAKRLAQILKTDCQVIL